jgi:hypothetical protein
VIDWQVLISIDWFCSFALGMIFLSNEAFPLIFGRGNGGHLWTSYGAINLTFLSYVVGSLL